MAVLPERGHRHERGKRYPFGQLKYSQKGELRREGASKRRQGMRAHMLMDWKDAIGTGMDTIVGAVVGWLVASFTNVSKAEVRQLKADYDHKHELLVTEIKALASKAEVVEIQRQVRAEAVEMQRQLREDIAALRAAILERG